MAASWSIPTNPDIVYVAALGDLWGPNKERGVYKSTDGGATWALTLAINENTGVSDIAIDPASPNILYAAAYQRRRTVFGLQRRRSRWQPLPFHRRRHSLDQNGRRPARHRRCGPLLHRHLSQEHQYRLRGIRARHARRRLPLRRQGRHLDPHERHQSRAPPTSARSASIPTTIRRSGSAESTSICRRMAAGPSCRPVSATSTATFTPSGSTPPIPTTCSAATTAASGSPGTAAAIGVT